MTSNEIHDLHCDTVVFTYRKLVVKGPIRPADFWKAIAGQKHHHTMSNATRALCDYLVRRAKADHYEYAPCGKHGERVITGPKWQHGAIRCKRHTRMAAQKNAYLSPDPP